LAYILGPPYSDQTKAAMGQAIRNDLAPNESALLQHTAKTAAKIHIALYVLGQAQGQIIEGLSDQGRAQWTAKVRSAVVDDEAFLKSLNGLDMWVLVHGLLQHKDRVGAGIVSAAYLGNEQARAGADSKDLALLTIQVVRRKKDSAAAVLPEVESLLLARHEEAPLGWEAAKCMAYAFEAFNDRTKACEWAFRTYEVALPDEQARVSATADMLLDLAHMSLIVSRDGKKDDARTIMSDLDPLLLARHRETPLRWSNCEMLAYCWAPHDLPKAQTWAKKAAEVGLSHDQGKTSGWRELWQLTLLLRNVKLPKEAAAARTRLVEHLTTQCIPDKVKTKDVPLARWRYFTETFRDSLSRETRVTWARGLRAAFASEPGASVAMAKGDFNALCQAMELLDLAEASEMASASLADTSARAGASASVLAKLAKLSSYRNARSTRPLMDDMEAIWNSATGGNELSWQECEAISWAWHRLRDPAKARRWALKARDVAIGTEEARDRVDWRTLMRLGSHFVMVGLDGRDTGYPAFAAAIVSMAKRGKLAEPYYSECAITVKTVGRLLQTPQAREPLYTVLTDSQGHVRTGVASILAWAHRYSGELASWKQFLDGKIASAQIGPDAKAHWLLARAFAESVGDGSTDPFLGERWMLEALATAQAWDARLYVVRRIALSYAFIEATEKGTSFLDSVENQFTESAESAKAFRAVREEFDSILRQNRAWSKRKIDEQRAARGRRYRTALLYRLATAQKRGDQAEISRLEQLLSQAE